MKKTFPLKVPGKADARVVEAIKYEVRKYVKRERNKPLPPGFEIWEFACKVGATPKSAEDKLLGDVGSAIDAIARSEVAAVYIEVIAGPARRAVLASPPISAPSSERPATLLNAPSV